MCIRIRIWRAPSTTPSVWALLTGVASGCNVPRTTSQDCLSCRPQTPQLISLFGENWYQGLTFDGRRFHCSAPWTGDRWVLTAYTSGNWSKLDASDFKHLQSLDFPLPAIAPLEAAPVAPSGPAESGSNGQRRSRQATRKAQKHHSTQGSLAFLLRLFLLLLPQLRETSSWSCVAGRTGLCPRPFWPQGCQLTSYAGRIKIS